MEEEILKPMTTKAFPKDNYSIKTYYNESDYNEAGLIVLTGERYKMTIKSVSFYFQVVESGAQEKSHTVSDDGHPHLLYQVENSRMIWNIVKQSAFVIADTKEEAYKRLRHYRVYLNQMTVDFVMTSGEPTIVIEEVG